MAWTNSDFESQPTRALRLSKLRAYKDEIHVRVDANISSGDASRENDVLVKMLEYLDRREQQIIQGTSDIESTDPRVTSAFTIGRPV